MSDDFIDQIIADSQVEAQADTAEDAEQGATEVVTEEPSQAEQEVKEPKAAEPEEPTDAEDAQEDGDDDSEGEPQIEAEGDKVRDAMQKRINRQTAANHQLQRKLQEMQAEIERSKSAPQKELNPEEFETQEQFDEARVNALVEQKLQQRMSEMQKQTELQQIEQAQRELVKKAETRANELRLEHSDFDDRVSDAGATIELWDKHQPQYAAVQDALRESDDPAAVAYYLGQNPDVLDELETAPTSRIYSKILVDVQSKVNATEKTEDQKVEPKPKPPTPVGAKAKTSKPLHKQDADKIVEWALS